MSSTRPQNTLARHRRKTARREKRKIREAAIKAGRDQLKELYPHINRLAREFSKLNGALQRALVDYTSVIDYEDRMQVTAALNATSAFLMECERITHFARKHGAGPAHADSMRGGIPVIPPLRISMGSILNPEVLGIGRDEVLLGRIQNLDANIEEFTRLTDSLRNNILGVHVQHRQYRHRRVLDTMAVTDVLAYILTNAGVRYGQKEGTPEA